MNHLPELIRDLGLILFVAGVTTLLFRKLKQPLVLGYILAGFLVSPNFTLMPSVADAADIRIWAEIGVIFLLFTLGLEFSFKKLIRIGGTASVTALVEVSAMLLVGFSLGKAMGWQLMDCIFLGGILSISSTTIILRAFDELGVKSKRFANLVFGVLIIEDLVAVVLLVLLSTIAVSRQIEGGNMLFSILKLSFFLMLWFVAGIFFLPTFLRRTQKLLSDETMLIMSIGLCLMMVILASNAGFSPALGAFIMGSILAETTQAERIEHLVKPVKDLFGAVFFVSVGMLIDIRVLANYGLPVAIITVVFILFKTFNVALGAVISGQPLKVALQAGMSQAQIGEFSFIIATLGLTLKVTSGFLYPVAVAVSAITTFTTPYMIRGSGAFYFWVENKLPLRWTKALKRYSAGTQTITQASDWQLVIRAFFSHVLLFSLIILGVNLLFSSYVQPLVLRLMDDVQAANLVAATLCFASIAPFLWALVTRKFQTAAFASLWANKRFRAPLIFFRVVRGALAIVYVSIFLLSFFSFSVALAGLLILVATGLIFTRRIHAFYIRLETRFFNNFHDREREQAAKNRVELAPWDAHIAQFRLEIGTPVTGMTLEEMAIRERFGVNIAMIRRGEHYTINAPSRFERVYPGDVLFVIGTDEQLDQLRRYIEPTGDTLVESEGPEKIVLKKIVVKNGSFLCKKSIRESGIRERTNGLVVGLERNNRRRLNPESSVVLEENDLLWVVGEEKLIDQVLR